MLEQLRQGLSGSAFMLSLLLAGFAVVPLTACDNDPKVRVETRDVGDDAEDAVEKMGDKVEDSLEKAGDKIEDATDK